VVTPNQFEAELLTGQVIRTEADALRVMEALHERGVGTVILSSTELGNSNQEDSPYLLGLASQRMQPPVASPDVAVGSAEPPPPSATVVRVKIPRLEGSIVGAGDLFTALSTAWLFNSGGDLRLAMEKSASSVHAVLKRTTAQAQVESLEEQLEHSKEDIENPPTTVVAEVLHEANKEQQQQQVREQQQHQVQEQQQQHAHNQLQQKPLHQQKEELQQKQQQQLLQQQQQLQHQQQQPELQMQQQEPPQQHPPPPQQELQQKQQGQLLQQQLELQQQQEKGSKDDANKKTD
jgi:flagellar biosynthesis GTPase FlhF